MEISVIASGSNGNCCLVEKEDTSILIDAGKSGKQIEQRMVNLGKHPENIDAIVITHSHHDHISGAGVLARRFNIPIFMSKQTFLESRFKIGTAEIKQFNRGFRIKNMEIKPIATSHKVHSHGFKIDNFGLFTDTGIVTKEMKDTIPKLKAVLLETNHDIDMVINGFYPYFLKQWILSDIGHLNNIDAANLIQNHGKSINTALLGHLSGNNNTKEVVEKTFQTLVKRKIDFSVLDRDKESGTWEI